MKALKYAIKITSIAAAVSVVIGYLFIFPAYGIPEFIRMQGLSNAGARIELWYFLFLLCWIVPIAMCVILYIIHLISKVVCWAWR